MAKFIKITANEPAGTVNYYFNCDSIEAVLDMPTGLAIRTKSGKTEIFNEDEITAEAQQQFIAQLNDEHWDGCRNIPVYEGSTTDDIEFLKTDTSGKSITDID